MPGPTASGPPNTQRTDLPALNGTRCCRRVECGDLWQQAHYVRAGMRQLISAAEHMCELVLQTHRGTARGTSRRARHPRSVSVRALRSSGRPDSPRQAVRQCANGFLGHHRATAEWLSGA